MDLLNLVSILQILYNTPLLNLFWGRNRSFNDRKLVPRASAWRYGQKGLQEISYGARDQNVYWLSCAKLCALPWLPTDNVTSKLPKLYVCLLNLLIVTSIDKISNICKVCTKNCLLWSLCFTGLDVGWLSKDKRSSSCSPTTWNICQTRWLVLFLI